jgi:hypothetical protein
MAGAILAAPPSLWPETVRDLMPVDHLTRNDLEPIDYPGQAWNALTVGAFTDKVDIIDPAFAGYAPIAPAGELSPRSRTSGRWDR